jgi:hypothetical protein
MRFPEGADPFMAAHATEPAHQSDWLEAFVALGFLVAGVAVVVWWSVIGAASHPAMMVGIACLIALVLWEWNPAHAVGAMVLLTVFQNWGVSIATPLLVDPNAFQMLQGTNFAVLAVLAVRASIALTSGKTQHGTCVLWIRRWVFVATALVAAYAVLGISLVSVTSVAIYFRYTTTGVAALIVGSAAAQTVGARKILLSIMAVAAVSTILLAPELLASERYFRLIGAPEFFTLKYGETYSAQGVLDLVTRRFFNLPIEVDAISRRLMSSVMHQVSYGYVLLAGATASIALGYGVLGAGFCVLTFLAGVKGPLIALLIVLVVLSWRRVSARGVGPLLVGIGLAYVLGGASIGLMLRDQHAVGFLAGLQSLLLAPWGNGLGVGGNLSDAVREIGGADWDRWRSQGAPFALESAIGVLFYQMGFCAFLVLHLFVGSVRRVISVPAMGNVGIVVGSAFAAVLANGVFQEEAFSPYAIGFMALMVGATLADPSAQELKWGD